MPPLFTPPDDVLACCHGLASPDAVTHYVTLTEALGQRWSGETALVFAGAQVWAATRGSLLDPWRPHPIDPASLHLSRDGWQRVLHLRAPDGSPYAVEVSSFKADDLTDALTSLSALTTHSTLSAAAPPPEASEPPGFIGAAPHARALGLLQAPQRLLLGALKATQAKLVRVLCARTLRRRR